ncbi:MAG TPA: phosphoenolpyruvate--protein phosphotransferase [Chloroflexus aurantiacus]|jgi:phosphocarrier protein FPr|uniref:Phosphocarrier protein HPr n=1 Tax=Chloroflexus aurantiacus (strain ATCC 29366 / DSM 635 / J-10-fl) TaxID=324602 RepID=A9WGB8_CHLAA|nr:MULTISPECIES: phosphoenolpyruvate--protein phosphotransferase [Chloroflexus]ABY34039.1 phosphoenolpyruvate-protein phosphotransferase [Chloroflexus aurantiacus J-10-fl]RMG53529.1 MAG: phosphoenolpyruvate--protein phosphotransferase [Chloroflexota bacterium]GIV93719.1 MAG: phosphoenolpyruvate--protein phosphotransferase [Chloroflexus sp.]HBW66073.1 phosphoenolpyruvate--protein phosphotransferase [Chloroflexus aurantiacus]
MVKLTAASVRIGATATSKAEAIRQVGQVLVEAGHIQPAYIESMLAREALANTFLGNGIAIPHGKPEDRDLILETGIAVLQIPNGVTWNAGETARLIVGIAARSDEHIDILRRLTRVLGDAALVERLSQTRDPADIVEALTGSRPLPASPSPGDYDHAIQVVIHNPTGLHARPATAFVETARRFQAAVRVRYGDAVADGKSLLSLLQLGVSSGASVTISAQGTDAPAALAALKALVESGMGEEPVAEDTANRPKVPYRGWVPQHVATTINGIAAAEGLAVGPIRHYRRAPLVVSDTPGDRMSEATALERAIAEARSELELVAGEVSRRLGSSRAAIFRAHAELLTDPALMRETVSRIFDGHSAAWAWQQTIAARVAQLEKLDDPVLAGRAVDLSDVGQRVLRHLLGLGEMPFISLAEPAILVADDLTPSDTATLDPDSVLGLCTALGGPTSHTAIIARSLGLPAIVAAGTAVLDIEDGTPAILDGYSGRLYLRPSAADVEAARALRAGLDQEQAVAFATRHQPAITRDGVHIEVAANVNRVADVVRALENGADGVGLMRTEFLFLERDSAPDEEEQYQAYRAMVEAMNGRPLIIRTLDIGGDKEAPYLNIAREDNSFLGIRGLRLCLRRPDLFEPQLRAIYRAAMHGPLKMMFPMVATLEEVQQAKAIAERIRAELNAPPVEIGIMVEVPSAAMLADVLAQEVDFFSIGTNDLTQYVLAMDRLHPDLARQADSLHPAVLRTIARTVEGAASAGRWVGVCGGIASDPLGAAILVGLGVQELSVSIPSVATIKAHLRGLSAADLRDLARRALACRNAAEVRAL